MSRYIILSYGSSPGPELKRLRDSYYPEAQMIHINSGQELSLEKLIHATEELSNYTGIIVCYSNFTSLCTKRWELMGDVLYIHGYFFDYNSEKQGTSIDRIKIYSGSGISFVDRKSVV